MAILSSTNQTALEAAIDGEIEARIQAIDEEAAARAAADALIAADLAVIETVASASSGPATTTLTHVAAAALIEAIGSDGTWLSVTTVAAHGLADGDYVTISGTSAYNGTYGPIDVTAADVFRVATVIPLTAGEVVGYARTSALRVADSTGFAASMNIEVVNDAGAVHVTTIASTTTGILHMTDAVPTTWSSGSKASVGRPVALVNKETVLARGGFSSLKARLDAMILSVMDFGAVGDGTTDDLAAFNAMVAHGQALYDDTGARGVYVIPSARYHLSSPLQLTAPAKYEAYGAIVDNTVWVADIQMSIEGLYVDGARYNGFVLHRMQYNMLLNCGATNCGGFGLVAGGYYRSQLALGKTELFESKDNAGGLSISTGIGGLHCIQLPGDAYSPGTITNAGSGYTNGTWVAPATGGTGVRAILAFTVAGGVVTECQPIHGGKSYVAGDTLSFSNAAARNEAGDAISAGSGFVYTVGDVQDRRGWHNSVVHDRPIIRSNWRYAVQMEHANSYDLWIAPQIEGNRTRDVPLIQGSALAWCMISPHIAAVRVFSPTPSIVPTSLNRVTTTATLTSTAHGLAVGDFILVTAPVPFNGLFRIATVANANTATFTVDDTGATEVTEIESGEDSTPSALWVKAVADTNDGVALIDLESTNSDGRSVTILGGRIGNQFSTSLAPRVDLVKLDVSPSITNTEIFSHLTTNFGNTARTFTPTLSFTTPGDAAFVYTTRVGKYFEQPGMMYVAMEIEASLTYTTASGTLQITGLPAAASATPSRHPLTNARLDNFNVAATAIDVAASVIANNATIYLYQIRDALATSDIGTGEMASGLTYRLEIAGWYMT